MTTQKTVQQSRGRGFYLLPNIFTTIGLFAGFYAIIAAINGHTDNAIIAVYVGMFADGLDGRVARLTGTQSAFGVQYDSLADLVGFGITPALVTYTVMLHSLGKIGWLVAFAYLVATALRLARFNITTNEDRRYFLGLPCPAAAGVIVSFMWVIHSLGLTGKFVSVLVALAMVLVAVLMTSNIPYPSFKDIDLKGKVPFFFILICALVVMAIAWNPPWVFLVMALSYLFSGWFIFVRRRKRSSRRQQSQDQPDSETESPSS